MIPQGARDGGLGCVDSFCVEVLRCVVVQRLGNGNDYHQLGVIDGN